MTLRVLHVYKDVHPTVRGGIERHIDTLRRSVPGVVSDVAVCSRSRRTSEASVAGGIELRVAELGRVLSTPLAPTFPRALRRLPTPDVVHVHTPNPTGELAALTLPRSLPLVVSYHADIVRQAALLPLYRPLLRALLRRARAVVASSRALAEASPELRRLDCVETIPFGVDTDAFDPARVDRAQVAALRERHGPRIVIACGRLVHYKGFDRLIRIAPRLDATVLIVGAGPRERELRAQARGTGRVKLLGALDDDALRAHLAAADAFALPASNRAESFGIATVEAQAMGLPAVVCDVGTGTTEAIDPDRTGLAVPNDDQALADALRRLLDDHELRARLGGRARPRAIERHSLHAAGERFAALYAGIVARR